MGIEKSEFVNPVPSTDMYYFDKEPVTLEKIRNKKPILTYEDALKILNHFYYNHFNLFITTGFLAWSGARIQEVVSIKLVSLDLKNRFFFNILKKTKQEDTYGVYFFPKFFVKHVKLYLDQMKLVFPDAIYLFPSRYLKDSHVVQQTVRNKIHEAADLLGITSKVNPHAFRKRLNTERKRTGVMPEDRSILLNHNLNSTQAKHYLLQMEDFKEMKDLYDANFPYEEFQPNPNYLKDY
jgi:integrase